MPSRLMSKSFAGDILPIDKRCLFVIEYFHCDKKLSKCFILILIDALIPGDI
jgi:hypothetical protein